MDDDLLLGCTVQEQYSQFVCCFLGIQVLVPTYHPRLMSRQGTASCDVSHQKLPESEWPKKLFTIESANRVYNSTVISFNLHL